MKDNVGECNARIHQENYSDFAEATLGDVFKVFLHASGQYVDVHGLNDKCLNLQVKYITSDIPKGTISILKNVADLIELTTYQTVIIKQVNKEEIEIRCLELTFKDQYIGRRDMWSLKEALRDRCVYFGQKLEHDSTRCQIDKLWFRKDDKLYAGNSGYISKNTKIVFRSSTAMMFLLIQMSKEMWEFDIGGDLYFEKAIEFLSILFNEWKTDSCNHDVTVVLFSRTLFDTDITDDKKTDAEAAAVPKYKDFYRVITQSERRSDWSTLLIELKRYFGTYLQHVKVKCEGAEQETGMNSSCSQGNCLEAMNLALNLLEKHYIDRNFDRTGQCITVITPGSGIFEVEKQLVDITKQRISDYGIAADLLCLGEVPLCYVPLLKIKGMDDKYEVPDDWINLSGYTSRTQMEMRKMSKRYFIPRLNFSNDLLNSLKLNSKSISADQFTATDEADIDYDKYDAEVFNYGSGIQSKNNEWELKENSNELLAQDRQNNYAEVEDDFYGQIEIFHPSKMKKRQRHHSRWNDVILQSLHRSQEVTIQENPKYIPPSCVFSSKTVALAALNHMSQWDDDDLRGNENENEKHDETTENGSNIEEFVESSSEGIMGLKSKYGTAYYYINRKASSEPTHTTRSQDPDTYWDYYERIDWRSLKQPACLPLTSHEYPTREVLEEYYSTSKEVRLLERFSESEAEYLYQMMILQRISQGFQVFPVENKGDLSKPYLNLEEYESNRICKLSMGPILHELYLTQRTVYFVRHYLKKQSERCKVLYNYELWPIQGRGYSSTKVKLKRDTLKDLDWLFIDTYLIDRSFQSANKILIDKANRSVQSENELVKIWELRLLLLPILSTLVSYKSTTLNTLYISLPERYSETKSSASSDSINLRDLIILEQFFKLIENLNRFKRMPSSQPLLKPSQQKAMKSFLNLDEINSNVVIPNRDDNTTEARNTDRLEAVLKVQCLEEIVRLMLDNKSGLPVLDKQGDLPNNTFISATFVGWSIEYIDGIDSVGLALCLGQRLLERKYISCVTSSTNDSFLYGYYLYVVSADIAKSDQVSDNKWLEIGAVGTKFNAVHCAQLPQEECKKLLQVEVDHKRQSSDSFQEWFTVCYDAAYKPGSAYQLEVQWLVASATAVKEAMQDWGRRARTAGFFLVPVPFIPFPEFSSIHPFYSAAEIDADISCLTTEELNITDSLIITKFLGFIEFVMQGKDFVPWFSAKLNRFERLFVHATGVALVKCRLEKKESKDDILITETSNITSLNDVNIHIYWSHNYMLSKRWNSNLDSQQHDKLLSEFRNFWKNDENKLQQSWTAFGQLSA